MDHIKQTHLRPMRNKSIFVQHVSADTLIQETLDRPMIKKRHDTKPHRQWFMRDFRRVIGYRGMDGAPCYWLAVLMQGSILVTAYPIPHPKTMNFMRRR